MAVILQSLSLLLLLACTVCRGQKAQLGTCEDSLLECAQLDKERELCKDPIDSIRFCPRYCGLCSDPSPTTFVCQDFDPDCPTLAETQFCEQEDLPRKVCPKSCGFCGRSTPTTPVPTPDPSCRDNDADCPNLINSHFCYEDELVRRLCPLSCQVCFKGPLSTVKTQPMPTSEPQNGECVDKDPDCFGLVGSHFCREEDLVSRLCPRSCGLCVTTTLSTTSKATLIPPEECYDREADCSFLIKSHYCGEEPLVRKLCPVSCQLCVPGASIKPPVKDNNTCMDLIPDCRSRLDECKNNSVVAKACPFSCETCFAAVTGMTTDLPEVTTDMKETMLVDMTTDMKETMLVDMTTEKTTEGSVRPTLPSLGPYTPPADCKDLDPDCKQLSQKFSCDTDPLIIRLCPDSCHLCPDNKTAPVNQGCRDYDDQCDVLAPHCADDPRVQKLCPETCFGCTTASTLTEVTTDSMEVTTEEATSEAMKATTDAMERMETTTEEAMTTVKLLAPTSDTFPTLKPFVPPVDACFDHDNECGVFQQSNFCQDNQLVPRLCPASCGLCVGLTELPITSGPDSTSATATCMDFDPDCGKLKDSCTQNALVPRLCRKTCGLCGTPTQEPMTTDGMLVTDIEVTTEAGVTDIGQMNATEELTTEEMTTTPRTSLRPQIGLHCRQCADPFCTEEVENIVQCPNETPYCLNSIINNNDGTFTLDKGCASTQQCIELYTRYTQSVQTCQYYDPNVYYYQKFSCFFCCTDDNCNAHVKPPIDSLFVYQP